MSNNKALVESPEVTENIVTLESITELAQHLSPLDKIRLIERLISGLDEAVVPAPPEPRDSLLGLWEDFGPAPTEEEIDEARREAWANFPREDYYK